MTVAVAAKFKGGILCCSDSAMTSGTSRYTAQYIKGEKRHDTFVMYAGTLYWAQEVMFSEKLPLRDAIKEVIDKLSDDKEEDSCEFIEVKDGEITVYEDNGGFMAAGDYAVIGSGSAIARALMKMVYSPGRSEKWLRQHLINVIRIVSEEDITVFGPARFEVIND